MRELSVYIHIPFCVRKCRYCDFLSFPGTERDREEYVRALLQEIQTEALGCRDFSVPTVFIGGGTPSAVKPEFIRDVLETVRACFFVEAQAEISMEINPGAVEREAFAVYRDVGINRLSIGLQSADDGELERLGRIHTWAGFLDTYEKAVEAGFTNLNVDMMFGLPGQSPAGYERNLKKVLSLSPPPAHISAYGLIVEEGTPFFELQREGKLELPDEDRERAMYRRTEELLRERGYRRYEISNYALPGYACRHNVRYWRRGNYLGLGLGAASLVDNARRSNETDMEAYLARVREGKEPPSKQALSREEQMEEFMFLGLRLAEGVSRAEFRDTFGVEMEETYGDALLKHAGEGLLETGERVRLTPRGVDVSNYVMADFLF